MRNRGILAGLFLAQTLGAFAAQATLQDGVNSYAGTRDTMIYSNFPDNSGGGETGLICGNTNQLTPQLDFITRRGLLRFDLSSIPAGSTIQSITLAVTMSLGSPGIGNKPVALHRLLADWGEGANNASGNGGNGGLPALAGDATWNANFHGATVWTAQGGDFVSSASAVLSLGTTGNLQYTISDAGLASDVQAWVNDPSGNFGWILIGKEDATATARRIYSHEEGTVGRRPSLTVDYLEPVNGARHWQIYR